MSPQFPDFRARAPWWGADLQTLRNALRPAAQPDRGRRTQRLLLPLGDGSGDALSAVLTGPEADSESVPLVVLIHGLSGSEDSAYMHRSADFWHRRGHRVLRLNLRGAGASRPHCRFQYHAGRSEDLLAALRGLDPTLLRSGLILVGYSLGGNVLLKFVAEYGGDFPIHAAASVSAPIDLAAASQRFLARRNVVYQRHLLRSMKEECFGGLAEMDEAEAAAVRSARSVYEFDEFFVAPRNGFRDAAHYYAECHARRFLDEIRVPTLLVHSLDDPWIPPESYTDHGWGANPRVVPLLSRGGGHVGFHDRADRVPWYDRCIALFCEAC